VLSRGDFDAGSIAAGTESVRIRRWITSAHAPKANDETMRLTPICATFCFQWSNLLSLDNIIGHDRAAEPFELELPPKFGLDKIFEPAHGLLICQDLATYRLGA
jgi:hypothetical protein